MSTFGLCWRYDCEDQNRVVTWERWWELEKIRRREQPSPRIWTAHIGGKP